MISILLPTYKSQYLEAAIKSVICQTYKDWELIIVNDNSPHPIDKIVKKFSDDSRIRYYVNETNLGKKDIVSNWNKCLKYAKGELCCLICDDDIYKPTFLEEMIKLSFQYSQCNVFRSGVEVINKNNEVYDFYPSSPEWENCEDYIWHVLKGYRCQTITEWVYRTEHIKNLGGFISLPLAWYSDFLSIFVFSQNGGIASTPKRLVQFRMSGENITSQKGQNTILKMKASIIFESHLKDIIYNKSQYKEILNTLLTKYMRQKRSYTLSKCSFKDWLYLIKRKNYYNIDNKMIIKSIITKLI